MESPPKSPLHHCFVRPRLTGRPGSLPGVFRAWPGMSLGPMTPSISLSKGVLKTGFWRPFWRTDLEERLVKAMVAKQAQRRFHR